MECSHNDYVEKANVMLLLIVSHSLDGDVKPVGDIQQDQAMCRHRVSPSPSFTSTIVTHSIPHHTQNTTLYSHSQLHIDKTAGIENWS